MTAEGWYQDPDGSPGRFRYWDGNTWSTQTTANPQNTPPPTPDDNQPGGGRFGERGWIIALAILALVTILVVVLLISATGSMPGTGGKATEDTNSSAPTVSAWDETSTPTYTPPPLPTDTGGEWVDCPWSTGAGRTTQREGRLSSGRLSVTIPPRYEMGFGGFVLAYDFHGVSREVTFGIASSIGVGRISFADGFNQLSTTATQAMQCWSMTNHSLTTDHVVLIAGEQVTVSGQPGWHVRWEIFYEYEMISGEILDVIVVDMGQGADYFGLFLSCRPTGDPDFESSIASATASLQVI